MPSIDRGRRRDAGHADAWAARGVRHRHVRRDGCEPPRRAVTPVIVRHLGAGGSPHRAQPNCPSRHSRCQMSRLATKSSGTGRDSRATTSRATTAGEARHSPTASGTRHEQLRAHGDGPQRAPLPTRRLRGSSARAAHRAPQATREARVVGPSHNARRQPLLRRRPADGRALPLRRHHHPAGGARAERRTSRKGSPAPAGASPPRAPVPVRPTPAPPSPARKTRACARRYIGTAEELTRHPSLSQNQKITKPPPPPSPAAPS